MRLPLKNDRENFSPQSRFVMRFPGIKSQCATHEQCWPPLFNLYFCFVCHFVFLYLRHVCPFVFLHLSFAFLFVFTFCLEFFKSQDVCCCSHLITSCNGSQTHITMIYKLSALTNIFKWQKCKRRRTKLELTLPPTCNSRMTTEQGQFQPVS